MTLIKSISGIRGTIGGSPEDGLNPLSIVKFVAPSIATANSVVGVVARSISTTSNWP